MKKTFYVTTPIYYPSGNLHIGHLYTTTLAWTLANYKKMQGFDTKFLTGADEHGQKIQINAQAANKDPQIYVDEMTKKFQELWKLADIKYDYYSRTTNPKHKEAIKKQFTQLMNDGIIYKGKYTGLYSVSDEEFLTKTQAEEKDGKFYHPLSGHELVEVEEESYFFKMSKYDKWWKEYVQENNDFIIPHKIVKELKNNFVDKGLEDLSITRTSFEWGITINEDPKHVVYVWLDALNNYITALGYNSENDEDYQKYWVNGDEVVHIVGKEIARFHGIYWPIILKATGQRLPNTILSHGWIITPEGKMSKSKGNVVDPVDLINRYGAEVVKYFLVTQINIGQDGVFDEEILKNVFNSELANTYGNLVSRTIAMTLQNFDKPVKHIAPSKQIDKDLLTSISHHSNEFQTLMNNFEINKAFQSSMILAKKLNGYIDETKPWTLKEDLKRLEEVLNNLLNGIYAVTTMLSVVMPKKTNEVLKMLQLKELNFEDINRLDKFDGRLPIKGEILFSRIK